MKARCIFQLGFTHALRECKTYRQVVQVCVLISSAEQSLRILNYTLFKEAYDLMRYLLEIAAATCSSEVLRGKGICSRSWRLIDVTKGVSLHCSRYFLAENTHSLLRKSPGARETGAYCPNELIETARSLAEKVQKAIYASNSVGVCFALLIRANRGDLLGTALALRPLRKLCLQLAQ